MPRLLLVSNRLPVTVSVEGDRLQVTQSTGGLATGLRRPHERLQGLWFGWPGEVPGRDQRLKARVREELAKVRAVPLFLSQTEVHRYYDGFANGVLWPLFHYLLDRIPLQSQEWAAYRNVNMRFANLVADRYRSGDLIWIHDYHLMLAPAMIRRLLPDATIGFFLHIPFPSYEVFRLLPWRDELLKGILGADLIGFHTPSYLRHFAASVLHILGIETVVSDLWIEGRQVQLGAFPMGIDARAFSRLASTPEVMREARSLRMEQSGAQIVLGVDRLDYTKGIPLRLAAFERLLESEPSLRGKVMLMQVTVPSRLKVGAYKAFRRQVDGLVGRINSAYATFGAMPIHYLLQGFSEEQVASLYRAADVMLVTSLRDGMNLVAKEYVACRNDEDGVLILSEFAGASAQLADALPVNPYDVEGLAATIRRALAMPIEEQRMRMRRLRKSVLEEDVHHWVESYLDALTAVRDSGPGSGSPTRPSPRDAIDRTLERAAAAQSLALFLDYDGTLVPFVPDPEGAAPDQDLLSLLRRLGTRPRTSVHLVSGRRREQIDEWFGSLDIGLHAEHGLWSRWDRGSEWTAGRNVDTSWKEKVLPLLLEFSRRTPGASIEEKEASLVWHYRLADPEFGGLQAKELRIHLLELLSNLPVRVVSGERIVEVRSYEINKGIVLTEGLARMPEPGFVLAMGDDRTDEDLFSALPENSAGIHVGPAQSRAAVRLRNPAAAREFLKALANGN